MSIKRFLPLQPLNVETRELEANTKSNGWIAIDKVCAEMSDSQKSTFISGNLRITKKDTENAENKENINSYILPFEKSDDHSKITESQTIPTEITNKTSQVAEKSFSNGLKLESEFCSKEILKTRSTSHITDSMRSKLLSWMTEVCESFQLTREVFFLAIDVLDRYLASEGARGLKPSHFQLVGTACLFVSAKYESIELCQAEKYAAMTAGAFSAQEVVNMELRVLQCLKWRLNVPTCFTWLKMFLQLHSTGSLSIEKPQYSCYNLLRGAKLLSVVLFDPCCFRFQRSLISSTIFMILTKNSKTDKWENLTCHPNSDLNQCLRAISHVIISEIPSLSAIGHLAYKCRDSQDRHNLQEQEPINSKRKRFCSG